MNVNLWFAKDVDNNEIISVVNSDNKKVYMCPICNSIVIPKAIESKKITPHFAHIDKEKCSGEALIHWWLKHEFIKRGESFTINADKRINYVCKNFKTEVRYELNSGVYIPDIVVETECGNEIVFEMANTNKKQVKDYIDKWIDLDKIIVEVNIKDLTENDNSENKDFNALYYKGKCLNFNKRDGGYYNTIGKLKEYMISKGNGYDIEAVRKLDWFWDELIKYKNEELDEESLFITLEAISEKYYWTDWKVINNILKKHKSHDLLDRYKNWDVDNIKNKILSKYKDETFLSALELEWDSSVQLRLKSNISKVRTSVMSRYSENYIDKLYRYYSTLHYVVNKLEDTLCNTIQEITITNGRLEWNYPKNSTLFTISIKSSSTIKHYEFDFAKDTLYRYYPMYGECELLYKGDIDKEKLLNLLLENYKSNGKIQDIKCVNCEDSFDMEYGEFLHFKKRNLSLPKRCKSCRKKKKEVIK